MARKITNNGWHNPTQTTSTELLQFGKAGQLKRHQSKMEKSDCTTCLFRMTHIRTAFGILHEWHMSIQLKWKKNLMTQPMIKLLWVKPGLWIACQLLRSNCLGHIPTRMNCKVFKRISFSSYHKYIACVTIQPLPCTLWMTVEHKHPL